MNEVVFSVIRLVVGGPKLKETTTQVIKTEMAVMRVLMTRVLGRMTTPWRFRFKDAKIVSNTAVSRAIWPPYISSDKNTRASEIVRWIFVRGSWTRRWELRNIVTSE